MEMVGLMPSALVTWPQPASGSTGTAPPLLALLWRGGRPVRTGGGPLRKVNPGSRRGGWMLGAAGGTAPRGRLRLGWPPSGWQSLSVMGLAGLAGAGACRQTLAPSQEGQSRGQAPGSGCTQRCNVGVQGSHAPSSHPPFELMGGDAGPNGQMARLMRQRQPYE